MLKNVMSGLQVREVYSGYAGLFNLGMVNWTGAPVFILHCINFINKVILKLAALFRVRFETSVFSPYILYIGKK